jgi:hypothetical protein
VWGGTPRRTTGIIGSFVLVGISMIVIEVWPNPWFPAIGLFGMGLAEATVNAHWLSIIRAKVGLELQGRVIAMTLMLTWITVPAGFLVAGPVTERVFGPLFTPGRGIAVAIMIAGVCVVLLGIGAYRYRTVRFLEDDLPDVIPDGVVITDKDVLQQQLDESIGRI